MKSPVIKKLTIKRFRSFPVAMVELGNPMFVVGRNGAGKSNFSDIFSFVSEAMSSPIQAVFDRRGGIAAVRNRSSGNSYPPNLGLCLEFGECGEFIAGRFAFEVKALPNYGFQIVREQCIVRLNGGNRWWYDRAASFETNATGFKPSLEPSALCLPVIGGDERFAPAFKLLGGMRVYSIEPAKLREMEDPDSGVALKPDGSNAASVLQEIGRQPDAKATLAEINRILGTIVPSTKSVKPKKHGNKLSLEFSQEWATSKKLNFEAFNMSDGTLRSLGLIMAVFQEPKPSILVIEEPESTIHPGALGAVLDLIRLAAKNMQVIVTTHSPELLDANWIKDENLRVVTWEKGASHVLPPSDATREAMRQHVMGAGDLLRSNSLQSQPIELFKDGDRLKQGGLFEDLS